MSTFYGRFNDRSVQHFLDKQVARDFKDVRYSNLLLRARQCRDKASVFLRVFVGGKERWQKLGNWPDVKCADVVKALPAKTLAVRDEVVQQLGLCETFGAVFERYLIRLERDVTLSDKRREGLRSIIKCQLAPRLADVRFAGLSTGEFDSVFVLPLINAVSATYVHTVWAALKSVMGRAFKLGWIDVDPLAGWSLSDFATVGVMHKPCAMTESRLLGVFSQLGSFGVQTLMLFSLMLLFGLRIGETRQLKWSMVGDDFIDLPGAITKTGEPLRLPLSVEVRALFLAYRDFAKGAFLFGAGNGRALSAQDASRLIRDFSGGEWSAHDLRKFARSMWLDRGGDYFVCELLLNHKLKKLDKTYIHAHAEKQKGAVLSDYHGYVFGLGLSGVLTEILPRYYFLLLKLKAA